MDYNVYDKDYYVNGPQSGKSLYENYSWKPDLTIPFARRIADYLGIDEDDTICDFGCARGYLVKAFKQLGYRAFGFDVSDWAISNADAEVANRVWLIRSGTTGVNNFEASAKKFDFVIAKDVLEHIPDEELARTIDTLMSKARKAVFVVVPLSPKDGEPYVVPEYEQDATHVQRRTLGWWAKALTRPGFCVGACHLVPGIKQNYAMWHEGNGFLVCRREVQL